MDINRLINDFVSSTAFIYFIVFILLAGGLFFRYWVNPNRKRRRSS